MNIRPIKTEADYDWALAEVAQYFGADEPAEGTPEGQRFDILAALIQAYEAVHWPIEAPDPIAAIQHVMEQQNYRQADLGRLFGSRSRASEVMNRKRPLTMEQARLLHMQWKIPAEALLRSEPHNG